MDFLSTALTAGSSAPLPPFAECIVLDFLFGRCIAHQRLAVSAVFLAGDKFREFWRMRAWLLAACERRNQMLSHSYLCDMHCASDPLFVFAYSFAKFMKMYLATSDSAAVWRAPTGDLANAGCDDDALVQSVTDLAVIAKTMPRFGSFKVHVA